jgi:hypothetical protein
MMICQFRFQVQEQVRRHGRHLQQGVLHAPERQVTLQADLELKQDFRKLFTSISNKKNPCLN